MNFIYTLTYYLSFGYYNSNKLIEEQIEKKDDNLEEKFQIVNNKLDLTEQISNFKFKNKVNINEKRDEKRFLFLKDILTVTNEDDTKQKPITYDNMIDEIKIKIKKPLKKTVYIKPEIEKKITILDEIHEFKFDPKKNKTAKKIKID